MSSLLHRYFGNAGVPAFVMSSLLASTALAQLTAPLGERRVVLSSRVPRWLGDVSACGGPLCTQTASAETSIPLAGGFQVVFGGGAGRMFDARSSWTSERRVDLRYATRPLSAWIGGVRTDGLVSDTTSPLRARLESGLRFATTNAELVLSFSAGRRTSRSSNIVRIPDQLTTSDSTTGRVDTIPGSISGAPSEIVSLTELRGTWSVGRFILSTTAGHSTASHSSSNFWGTVEAARALPRGPLAFLNIGFAAAPATVGFIALPRRSMSLGLRFSSATFATRAAERSGSDASPSMFTVQREALGRYRLRLRIPRARLVELASDCTGWKPVVLTRERGDDWEIVLPASAGSHLVNIRVDGGEWIAPPGLVAKTDDFAGAVGVFVVD
jgi:hypothetical protein